MGKLLSKKSQWRLSIHSHSLQPIYVRFTLLCLSPSLSLFPHSPHFSLTTSSPSSPPPSPPLPLPLSFTQTANKCLAYMIEEVNQLFMVSTDMLQACKFSYLEVGVPVPYTELGQDKYGFGDYRSYVEGCVTVMMKV